MSVLLLKLRNAYLYFNKLDHLDEYVMNRKRIVYQTILNVELANQAVGRQHSVALIDACNAYLMYKPKIRIAAVSQQQSHQNSLINAI